MNRRRSVGVLVSLMAWAAPAGAQRVPLRAGNTVRVASADAAAPTVWRAGTVLRATRLGVLLRASGELPDTFPVPFDASVRVQLRRRPNGPLFLGIGLGFVSGAVLGATAFNSTFGPSWGDPGVWAEVIGFGLLGGMVGGGVGLLTRPTHWEEILVSGLAMTPRARPVQPVGFSRRERWREFEPTEADFAAYFAHWKDSLEAVEGVWEFDVLWSGSALSRVPRMAIVRDGRYAGYDLIAVALPPRGVPAASSRYYGLVEFAMRQAERPGTFELRLTGSSRGGAHGDWAEFRDGRLEFHHRGQPLTTRWVKLERSPP